MSYHAPREPAEVIDAEGGAEVGLVPSFARSLQQHVSVAEWVVLSHVAARPEVRPGGLADHLGLTRGAVFKVLDKLEGKKWITRRTMPHATGCSSCP